MTFCCLSQHVCVLLSLLTILVLKLLDVVRRSIQHALGRCAEFHPFSLVGRGTSALKWMPRFVGVYPRSPVVLSLRRCVCVWSLLLFRCLRRACSASFWCAPHHPTRRRQGPTPTPTSQTVGRASERVTRVRRSSVVCAPAVPVPGLVVAAAAVVWLGRRSFGSVADAPRAIESARRGAQAAPADS